MALFSALAGPIGETIDRVLSLPILNTSERERVSTLRGEIASIQTTLSATLGNPASARAALISMIIRTRELDDIVTAACGRAHE
jgi:hypothetical protein